MSFLVNLLIAVALQVVAYLIMPKPKQPKQEFRQGESPTTAAGIPVPVLFGTVTIKSPNCLWWGDKYFEKSKVDA